MKRLARPASALVRAVSWRFATCLRQDDGEPIDVDRACAQHAAYVAALRDLGIAIEWIEAHEAHPDGCFVEDTAVVTGAHAALTTPGAPSRQAEVAEVFPVLARYCEIEQMTGAARLDGGDVLRAHDTLYVGLSRRTNAEGAAFLARVAAKDRVTVRTVPLAQGLHLKSVCSLIDEDTIGCAPSLDGGVACVLRSSGCELVELPEEIGANVLCLGDSLLASASAPLTVALLRERGHRVVDVDVSELHKGDGALTCLSLRIPPPGAWSA